MNKTKSNGFNPRGIVSWEPDRSLSVNLQVAKGFRLGGVNDPLNVPLCQGTDITTFGGFQKYKDETLWNYEAGVKYSKGIITFNAAAFYADIKNLQVTVTAGTCSSRVVFNVPKAHSEGRRGRIRGSPASRPRLLVRRQFAQLEIRFDVDRWDPARGDRRHRDGNRLPVVPKYQFAVTANYEQPFSATGQWYVNGSVQRVGSRYTQPADQEPAGPIDLTFFDPVTGAAGAVTTPLGTFPLRPYTLVNASLGLRWDSGLEISAYAKNIFDSDPRLSLDRERGLRARIGYNVGQPRTIGLLVRKSFGTHPAPPPPPAPPPAPPPPATQTCPDGSVIAATATCPAAPPPPPPPAAPERG